MKQNWKGLGSYGTVGLEFALSVLFGLFVGTWLDKKLGTHGWLSLLGFFLGLAAGAESLYRVFKQSQRELEREERAERQARKDFSDHPPDSPPRRHEKSEEDE